MLALYIGLSWFFTFVLVTTLIATTANPPVAIILPCLCVITYVGWAHAAWLYAHFLDDAIQNLKQRATATELLIDRPRLAGLLQQFGFLPATEAPQQHEHPEEGQILPRNNPE